MDLNATIAVLHERETLGHRHTEGSMCEDRSHPEAGERARAATENADPADTAGS